MCDFTLQSQYKLHYFWYNPVQEEKKCFRLIYHNLAALWENNLQPFFVTALAYSVMHSEDLPKWWPNFEVYTILQHQYLLFLLIVAVMGSISQNNCITLCIYYSSWCEKQVAMLTWQVCKRKETSSTGWWSLIQIQRSMASVRWYVLLVGFHKSQKVCECISNKCTRVELVSWIVLKVFTILDQEANCQVIQSCWTLVCYCGNSSCYELRSSTLEITIHPNIVHVSSNNYQVYLVLNEMCESSS